MSTHIRGRGRVLSDQMKVQLCELVAQSHTVEQAADMLDVSVRTVQRQRRDDEDFDHEVHMALQTRPNPKRLMETAARTHWRAAAWLLERTDPETYARRPVNTATAKQVDAALTYVLEALLQALSAELRGDLYEQGKAACEKAFDCAFPNYGPWGNPRSPKLPPTPIVDEHFMAEARDLSRYPHIDDYDDDPAAGRTPQAAPETTADSNTPPQSPTAKDPSRQTPRRPVKKSPRPSNPRWARDASQPLASARSKTAPGGSDFSPPIVSPKMRLATKSEPGDESVFTIHDLE